jgi:hypothetical protein
MVAVALTKLVARLGAPTVSKEKSDDLFMSLVIRVVSTLRSKDASARDAARESLAKMVQTAGVDSLYAVIYELEHSLKEGYQRHVRNYTLRGLLAAVLAEYTPPVDAPSVPVAPGEEAEAVGQGQGPGQPDVAAAAAERGRGKGKGKGRGKGAAPPAGKPPPSQQPPAPFTSSSSSSSATADGGAASGGQPPQVQMVQPAFDRCIPLIMRAVLDDINGVRGGSM